MVAREAKPSCVLLADTEPSAAIALEPLLVELGHALVRVDSESALLEAAGSADLVVLDVDFVEPLGGLRLARDLLSKFGLRVVYLSSRADTNVVSRAKLTHPYGYLLKPVRDFDLRSCLELALQRAGGLPTSTHRAPPAQLASLTARERDVLRLIVRGHTSKDIASTLSIAKATVDTYRGRLSEKLGAKSRADLVRIAQGAGLLD